MIIPDYGDNHEFLQRLDCNAGGTVWGANTGRGGSAVSSTDTRSVSGRSHREGARSLWARGLERCIREIVMQVSPRAGGHPATVLVEVTQIVSALNRPVKWNPNACYTMLAPCYTMLSSGLLSSDSVLIAGV